MSSTTEPDRDGRGSPLSTGPARPTCPARSVESTAIQAGVDVSFRGLRTIGRLLGLIGVTKAFAHRRWVLQVLVGAPGSEPLFSVGGGAHR
nr:hypothetical protein OG781_29510 [Streptomyces sp. NBC_00830]